MKTIAKIKKWGFLGLLGLMGFMGTVSCTDEPDGENFYTFTGEMMSDYLKNRPQFSEFYEIVGRAGLTDLLSTYGEYTCFAPTNEAVEEYLKSRGMSSLADLTDADCDTIARTHLIRNTYNTYEMLDGKSLTNRNLLGRALTPYWHVDEDSIMSVYIEDKAKVMNDLKDDSVENGIMQPVNAVIQKSNKYIDYLLAQNPKISTYYAALQATGVYDDITSIEDYDYKDEREARIKDKTQKYRYRSHVWTEVAWVPDQKILGHTIFVVTDSILSAKYGIAKGDLRALYDKACEIYDAVYPQDVNKPGHSFENLTDSVNPLRRFMQYHVLNKYVASVPDLTPLDYRSVVQTSTKVKTVGVDEDMLNPCDWHMTLLPHTMMKVEKVTVKKYIGPSIAEERYVNRRYDDDFQFEGQWIDPSSDPEYVQDSPNGHYFYVSDILAFSEDVQNTIQNVRIRMDFSTVFPEVIGNSLRYEGTFKDDATDVPDDAATPKNGRNYWFPPGYLDGVSFNYPNCYCVLRRPHSTFDSWQGDEWNLFGDYDFTFRIPPVPFSGDWQLRLGFAAEPTRGVMQVYFDGVPQGIPLDMTKNINDETMYLGDRFKGDLSAYDQMTDEEKAEDQKLLKNLGAYLDGRALFSWPNDGSSMSYFITHVARYRKILCQAYIDATKDHYIRFRVASNGLQGNNNEFMLDYLELVPKSVYGVEGTGDMEDDL